MHVDLPEDHFLIPSSMGYLLYAPLKGLLFLLSHQTARALALALTSRRSSELTPALKEIFDEISKPQQTRTSPVSPLDISPWSHLTLDLSSRCTLACVYCYAGQGGRDGADMSIDCAQHAIDLCISKISVYHSRDEQSGQFNLIFHGGSEPTTNWDLFVRVIAYAREEAEKHGLRLFISMSSNGFYSSRRASWIAKHVNNVSLSLDGFQIVQDAHRPTAKGGSSFRRVVQSAEVFHDSRSPAFSFGFRPTVTDFSVDMLPNIVAFFVDRFPGVGIAAEPVEEVGNCKNSGYVTPDPLKFAARFIEACTRFPDVNLIYSGFNGLGNLRQRFCSASEPQMAVLPSGAVTACYGYSLRDARLTGFVYGQYDHVRGRFIFDEDKMKWLRDLHVRSAGTCKDCFTRYHCAGDCPALRIAEEQNGVLMSNRKRCIINREIAKWFLIKEITYEGQHTSLEREHVSV